MSNTALQSAERIVSLAVSNFAARPGRQYSFCVGKPISETHVAPTDGAVTVGNASAFSWDGGVVYAASGAALTAVSGSPSPGQYAVANGVYQLNVGDALSKVVITYRFEGLSQANFPGALQAAFLQDGFAISDLINGAAYAVSQGWLTANSAPSDDVQNFTLEHPAGPRAAARRRRWRRRGSSLSMFAPRSTPRQAPPASPPRICSRPSSAWSATTPLRRKT